MKEVIGIGMLCVTAIFEAIMGIVSVVFIFCVILAACVVGACVLIPLGICWFLYTLIKKEDE